MPTKEEMLTKIYEQISDKTRKLGCLVEVQGDVYFIGDAGYNDHEEEPYYISESGWEQKKINPYSIDKTTYNFTKIIGNPVMIGDVLDWADKQSPKGEIYMPVLYYVSKWRKQKRLSIDAQDEEVIEYVYNLLPPT